MRVAVAATVLVGLGRGVGEFAGVFVAVPSGSSVGSTVGVSAGVFCGVMVGVLVGAVPSAQMPPEHVKLAQHRSASVQSEVRQSLFPEQPAPRPTQGGKSKQTAPSRHIRGEQQSPSAVQEAAPPPQVGVFCGVAVGVSVGLVVGVFSGVAVGAAQDPDWHVRPEQHTPPPPPTPHVCPTLLHVGAAQEPDWHIRPEQQSPSPTHVAPLPPQIAAGAQELCWHVRPAQQSGLPKHVPPDSLQLVVTHTSFWQTEPAQQEKPLLPQLNPAVWHRC